MDKAAEVFLTLFVFVFTTAIAACLVWLAWAGLTIFRFMPEPDAVIIAFLAVLLGITTTYQITRAPEPE